MEIPGEYQLLDEQDHTAICGPGLPEPARLLKLVKRKDGQFELVDYPDLSESRAERARRARARWQPWVDGMNRQAVLKAALTGRDG